MVLNPLPHRHRCCLDCRQQSRHRWHCSRHCISTVFVPTAICSWGASGIETAAASPPPWSRLLSAVAPRMVVTPPHRHRRHTATAFVSTADSSCGAGDIAAASPLPSSLLLSAVEAQVPSPRPSHHHRRSSTAVNSCDKNGFEEISLDSVGISRNLLESVGIGLSHSESVRIREWRALTTTGWEEGRSVGMNLLIRRYQLLPRARASRSA